MDIKIKMNITFLVLGYLALNSFLSFLTVFIIVIVYVGAIMILIGYICAISPNLLVEPSYSYFGVFLLFTFLMALLDWMRRETFSLSSSTLVDYFYSTQGIFIFFTLVFMLFVTLLIVTTQYSVPKGPFRSVTV